MVGDFGWEHEGTKSGVDTVNCSKPTLSLLGKVPSWSFD